MKPEAGPARNAVSAADRDLLRKIKQLTLQNDYALSTPRFSTSSDSIGEDRIACFQFLSRGFAMVENLVDGSNTTLLLEQTSMLVDIKQPRKYSVKKVYTCRLIYTIVVVLIFHADCSDKCCRVYCYSISHARPETCTCRDSDSCIHLLILINLYSKHLSNRNITQESEEWH